MTTRLIRLAIVGAFAIMVAGVVSWYLNAGPGTGTGSDGPVPAPSFANVGGPFALTDQSGQEVTDETYLGGYALIYFGYTYCPDVCPTELWKIVQALGQMPEEVAAQVTPILITIDPERDTPDALAQYVALFDPRLVGLTGTPEQIAEVADEYNVYYARIEDDEDPTRYTMDHSVYTYLVGPDGTVRNVFTNGQTAEQIAEAVTAEVEGGGSV
ncbi:MAG: SCO family protein [Rhodospirillaceae bacterium]|nr:SCO family protein [Rhodospirillaceae bacterium]